MAASALIRLRSHLNVLVNRLVNTLANKLRKIRPKPITF